MHDILEFFKTEPALAFLTATAIFLVTILLVVKKWISFPVTCLLLVFALAAGVLINNRYYFKDSLTEGFIPHLTSQIDKPVDFKDQIGQAIDELRQQMAIEKENLHQVMYQVQEIFDQMSIQRQKLQTFIDETRERFKTEYPLKDHQETPNENPSSAIDAVHKSI